MRYTFLKSQSVKIVLFAILGGASLGLATAAVAAPAAEVPFSFAFSFRGSEQSNTEIASYHVPAGMRAVVEFLSGGCYDSEVSLQDVAKLYVTTGGVSISFLIAPISRSPFGSGDSVDYSGMTRLYADAGTIIAFSDMQLGLTFSCSLSISGKLIAVTNAIS